MDSTSDYIPPHSPAVTPAMLPQLHLHGFVPKDAAAAKSRSSRELEMDLGRNATPDQVEAYIERLPPVYKDSVPKRPAAGNITEQKQGIIALADRVSVAAAREAVKTPTPSIIGLTEHLQRFASASPDIARDAATTALTSLGTSGGNQAVIAETVRLKIINDLTTELSVSELSQLLEQQRLDYITEGLISSDQPEDLAKTDLSSNLNLTKFIIGLDFSNNVEPPYSDCTVTLKIPSALLHYLFHGRLKSVAHAAASPRAAASRVPSPRAARRQQGADRQPISQTTAFRYIESGGWMSLQIPQDDRYSDSFITKKFKNKNRTVFFGKIHSINVSTTMMTDSIFDTTVTLRCYSFIYPYTVAQYRTTPQRLGQMAKVDPVALAQSGTGDTDANPHATAFEKWLRGTEKWQVDESTRQRALRAGQPDPRDNPTERPLGQILRYMVESLGYFHLPNSIAGEKTVGSITGPQRLGDHIMVIGDNVDNMSWTALGQNFDELDVIKGSPRPSYLVQSMKAPADNVTLWQEIRTAVQPPDMDRLIELFPMLVPVEQLEKTGTIIDQTKQSASTPAEAAARVVTRTSKGKDALKEIVGSQLVASLGAVPCLVYRWRPLPPKFDLTKNSLLSANHMQAGFEEIVGYEKVFGEIYFGKPTDNEGISDAKYNSSSKWFDIAPGLVVRTEISWTEHTRLNAVHCYPHFSTENSSQTVQPFGVLSVPLFDPQDINRHGMKMQTFQTPFYRHAMGNIRTDTAAEIAASAISERFYYSFGDGHAYGSGTITIAYTPQPNLVCGQWIKIDFDKVMGSTATHEINRVPLTAYCTAVRHIINIDQQTGLPDAQTVLNVERVSYGNRVPKIKHNAVTIQPGRRVAQSTARRADKRRPGTRGGR